jgi:hypothetical protein
LCLVIRALLGGTALALVTGVAAAAPLQSSPHTVVFRDAAGENAAGPDVTTVRVSSDGTALTLAVAAPSTPAFTGDMRLRIWLDADDDRRTGLAVEEPSGRDHFLLVDPTLFPASEARLYRCGTNTCSTLGTPSPYPFAYASGTTITLDAAALGLRRIERVAFSVVLTQGIAYDPVTGYDFTNARIDTAPNEGEWTFDARALRATSFRAGPSRPRAGRPFTLSLATIRTATGAAPAGAKATCSMSVGHKPVPGTARVVRRTARCSFAVPAGTRGKRFRATIRVRAAGASVARTISGRVG